MEKTSKRTHLVKIIQAFIHWESAGGFALFFMAILALILSNSPLNLYYQQFIEMPVTLGVGNFIISKSFTFWINDALMAIFFLLVGLEIKRELLIGELSHFKNAILPAIAAIGGMICPAIIYSIMNYHSPVALKGWAIPAATDIAFALGVLTLLGSRIPTSLKVLLTAIAILDDLGAILIIAIFYTEQLSGVMLSLAILLCLLLIFLNYVGVVKFFPYLLIGLLLWICVLNSGIHPTLVGVILAFIYPLKDKSNTHAYPSQKLELKLHPWVGFGVLPLFAFVNAGLPLTGFSWHVYQESIPLGIIFGLFLGKQVGIFGASWICIKLKIARMPYNSTWQSLYGIAILCGIGFTMSLFIGALAFTHQAASYSILVRIGVLSGSILSGVVGYIFLLICTTSYSNQSRQ